MSRSRGKQGRTSNATNTSSPKKIGLKTFNLLVRALTDVYLPSDLTGRERKGWAVQRLIESGFGPYSPWPGESEDDEDD